jgi:hyaluronan synthase
VADVLEPQLQALDSTPSALTDRVADSLSAVLVVSLLTALIYLAVRRDVSQSVVPELERHVVAWTIIRLSALWTLLAALLLAVRTVLWLRYRPSAPASFASAPSLTVIIPAYNEGAMVFKSIQSVAAARYPADRIEVLVIDDGSTDDTWQHIRSAAARYPDLVRTMRLAVNSGKRVALTLGFQQARGEIVVTVDSDSVVEPDALLALAGPFRNPRIGAVAGKVVVYNRRQGLIPRMLHVQYVLSFDLQRAAESSFRNVFCCPGALSAYRITLVRAVLRRWREQTFLGAPCTIGEDRALTNLILETGADAVYQCSAVVHTVAPSNYSGLCRMFIRWDRSYVREELQFLRIVWGRPLKQRLMALFDRLITNLRYPIHYAALGVVAALTAHHPWLALRVALAIGLVSLLNMAYYLRSERSLDFVYGVIYSYFAFVALSWVFPYSAFTARARSWLTR